MLFSRRENTVLRGHLFDRTDNDTPALTVNRNVYVIPNALVPEQFRPCVISSSSNTSEDPNQCLAALY